MCMYAHIQITSNVYTVHCTLQLNVNLVREFNVNLQDI